MEDPQDNSTSIVLIVQTAWIDYSIRQLVAAVKFTYSLPFVNPSRASPNLVVYEGGKICFTAENSSLGKNAVFLTTGFLTDSQLGASGVESTINPGHKVRSIELHRPKYPHSPAISIRSDRSF